MECEKNWKQIFKNRALLLLFIAFWVALAGVLMLLIAPDKDPVSYGAPRKDRYKVNVNAFIPRAWAIPSNFLILGVVLGYYLATGQINKILVKYFLIVGAVIFVGVGVAAFCMSIHYNMNFAAYLYSAIYLTLACIYIADIVFFFKKEGDEVAK